MDAAMPDKDVDSTVFLVNREHKISEDYIPEVRKTNVYGMSQSMRSDAAAALEEMFKAAKEESKISLATVSGYRRYSNQSTISSRKNKTLGSADKATLWSLCPRQRAPVGHGHGRSPKGQFPAQFRLR